MARPPFIMYLLTKLFVYLLTIKHRSSFAIMTHISLFGIVKLPA